MVGLASVCEGLAKPLSLAAGQAAYGAVLHLDCVAAASLLRRVAKLLTCERSGYLPAGDRNWTAPPRSSVQVLRKWMRKRAWTVVRPWVWRSSVAQTWWISHLGPRSRQGRDTMLFAKDGGFSSCAPSFAQAGMQHRTCFSTAQSSSC